MLESDRTLQGEAWKMPFISPAHDLLWQACGPRIRRRSLVNEISSLRICFPSDRLMLLSARQPSRRRSFFLIGCVTASELARGGRGAAFAWRGACILVLSRDHYSRPAALLPANGRYQPEGLCQRSAASPRAQYE